MTHSRKEIVEIEDDDYDEDINTINRMMTTKIRLTRVAKNRKVDGEQTESRQAYS
jgi:hypothetical protein